MNELISIVVPVYNSEKYLDKAIQSCLNQTYSNIEIITINDGSTDSSLEILNSYADRIKIISQENKGIAGAINTGIKAMNSNRYKLMNSDDLLYPDGVEILIKEIDKLNYKKTIIHGNYDIIDSNDKIIDESKELNRNQMSLFEQNVHLLAYNYLNAITSVFPRESFTKYGYYNESVKFAEDYELLLRFCLLHDFRLHFVEEKIAMYRHHPQQDTYRKNRKAPNYQEEIRKMILKSVEPKLSQKYKIALKQYQKLHQPPLKARTKRKMIDFFLRKTSPSSTKKIGKIYRKIRKKDPPKYLDENN